MARELYTHSEGTEWDNESECVKQTVTADGIITKRKGRKKRRKDGKKSQMGQTTTFGATYAGVTAYVGSPLVFFFWVGKAALTLAETIGRRDEKISA